MVAVGGGIAFQGHPKTTLPQTPSLANQAQRVARDRHFFDWCVAEELCVAMFVFAWHSVNASDAWLAGVEEQTQLLLPALAEMGGAIRNGSLPPSIVSPQNIHDLKMDDDESVRAGRNSSDLSIRGPELWPASASISASPAFVP